MKCYKDKVAFQVWKMLGKWQNKTENYKGRNNIQPQDKAAQD
jgi:hypothetical protein